MAETQEWVAPEHTIARLERERDEARATAGKREAIIRQKLEVIKTLQAENARLRGEVESGEAEIKRLGDVYIEQGEKLQALILEIRRIITGLTNDPETHNALQEAIDAAES